MGKNKAKNQQRKRHRKSKRGSSSSSGKRGGVMLGMRSGFQGIADSVAGKETQASEKYKWWGRIITVLLIAAAIGLLAGNL